MDRKYYPKKEKYATPQIQFLSLFHRTDSNLIYSCRLYSPFESFTDFG